MSKTDAVKNENNDTNYELSCVRCGNADEVHLVAHRDESYCITGFIVSCGECHELISGCDFKLLDKNNQRIG